MTLDAKSYVAALRAGTAEFFKDLGTAEEVKRAVKRELDKKKREIFAKILGFENKWGGEWEVDHCNNRRTGVDEALAGHVREAANEWVNDVIAGYQKKNGKGLKALPKPEQKAIIRDFECRVQRETQHLLYQATKDIAAQLKVELAARATQDVNKILENLDALVTLEDTEL